VTTLAETVINQIRYGATEDVKVGSWVTRQLVQSGLDFELAVMLAVTADCDYRRVVSALNHGATADQVARIFL
jgi:hypothetical protein